jgi:hypothetical protein
MQTTHRFLTASLASLSLLALLGLAACSDQPTQSAASDAELIAESAITVAVLQQQLSTELMAAMQSKGAVEAIEVCANVAQPMTAAVGTEAADRQISRTALRVRNPANQADALSERILQDWQTEMVASDSAPGPVVHHEGELVIVHHPILMQTGCLACHGEPAQIAPEVAEKLASLYPNDEATGFKVGQLRGAFRVEFAKP